jgi:putative Mg2+ transporter-C (MgtC) family protein
MNLTSASLDLTELLLRLALAVLFGFVLGLNREMHHHAAGLRTHMLIALSAAATTVVALEMYKAGPGEHGQGDPTRVIQGLAQALGFISAGVIIQGQGKVRGVTTAVEIWVCGAIGIACGGGYYVIGGITLGFAVFILVVMRFFERLFPRPDKNEPPHP